MVIAGMKINENRLFYRIRLKNRKILEKFITTIQNRFDKKIHNYYVERFEDHIWIDDKRFRLDIFDGKKNLYILITSTNKKLLDWFKRLALDTFGIASYSQNKQKSSKKTVDT